MCAFLPRNCAVWRIPVCWIGNGRTPSVGSRQEATPIFGTLADRGHFASAKVANNGRRLSQRQARAVAEGASKLPAAENARVTGNTLESQVKFCPDCQHSKLLIDFGTTVTSIDRRTDVCRACLAVLRAQSAQKELHHLGLSVEEAWARAKACTKCGQTKELRDFARASHCKDETYPFCRACASAVHAARTRSVPTNQPLQCAQCGVVREAEQFDLNSLNRTGRNRICKSCRAATQAVFRQRRRHTHTSLRREAKKCNACGKQKQAGKFNLNKASIDGLQNICRSCVSDVEKKRYELRKQEGLRRRQSVGI